MSDPRTDTAPPGGIDYIEVEESPRFTELKRKQRGFVFPMAVVPNLWGIWNMLYLTVRSRVRWSIGIHGALLPLLLMPLGVALASSLDVFQLQWKFVLPMAPVGMTVYYLAWKYLVGFLNQEVGIA